MSKHFPECPLSDHNNCKDFYNPKICAIAKKRKVCLRKRYNKSRKTHGGSNIPNGLSPPPDNWKEFKKMVNKVGQTIKKPDKE